MVEVTKLSASGIGSCGGGSSSSDGGSRWWEMRQPWMFAWVWRQEQCVKKQKKTITAAKQIKSKVYELTILWLQDQ